MRDQGELGSLPEPELPPLESLALAICYHYAASPLIANGGCLCRKVEEFLKQIVKESF